MTRHGKSGWTGQDTLLVVGVVLLLAALLAWMFLNS